jgi:hypothetical protein
MPEDTIASAVSRMSSSSMAQPNLFQLFQPKGGVGASGGFSASGARHRATVRFIVDTPSVRAGIRRRPTVVTVRQHGRTYRQPWAGERGLSTS